MALPTHDELLPLVERFLQRHDMAPTRFGRDATGEADLVGTLRAGRSPSLRLVEKIVAFMDTADAERVDHPSVLDGAEARDHVL